MNDTVEKLEQDVQLGDKQIEIDKNMFIYNMLNGLGDDMKKKLTTPSSRHKIFVQRIKNFFYKFFKMF